MKHGWLQVPLTTAQRPRDWASRGWCRFIRTPLLVYALMMLTSVIVLGWLLAKPPAGRSFRIGYPVS
jgi:hypothetical protein